MSGRDFSAEDRRKLAKSGAALPDGSFPIRDATDLENAIHDVGRASNPDRAKAHIKARAASLGLSDKLPDKWHAEDSEKEERRKSGSPKGKYQMWSSRESKGAL